MDWLHVLLLCLATFTAWEWLLEVLPVGLPAGLQPLAVVGLAYEAQRLPAPWLVSVAAAGVVALLHLRVRSQVTEPAPFRLPRRPSGRRVPDLP
jgi:hypothetical protein